MGEGVYRKELEAMEYVDNGMDLRCDALDTMLENDEELIALADHALYIEEKWRDIITDYVFKYYPTQAVCSAATNSPKGLEERKQMKKDFVLMDLQTKGKEKYDEAATEYTEMYLRKKSEWMKKAIPCAIGRTIDRLNENAEAIEAARNHFYPELCRLAWRELKCTIGINLWLVEEIKHHKEEMVKKIADAVSKYAFDTWK